PVGAVVFNTPWNTELAFRLPGPSAVPPQTETTALTKIPQADAWPGNTMSCVDLAPSAVVESKAMASRGWSKKSPPPARITVLPSPQGSQAIPSRGWKALL